MTHNLSEKNLKDGERDRFDRHFYESLGSAFKFFMQKYRDMLARYIEMETILSYFQLQK